MPIGNVPSVLEDGILCHDLIRNQEHVSVANPGVQERREKVVLPNGMRLHQYANLYFSYWNPMLSTIREHNEEICILAISLTVLDCEGCAITDRNAATTLAKFYSPEEGLQRLNFTKIHARHWNIGDIYQTRDHGAIKCAEVLIPERVPPEYIKGAYVVSETAKTDLLSTGFEHTVLVRPENFF